MTPRTLIHERKDIGNKRIRGGTGWAMEPIGILWRREKSVAPTGIQTSDHPAR